MKEEGVQHGMIVARWDREHEEHVNLISLLKADVERLAVERYSGGVNANFCVYPHKNLAVRKLMEAMRTAYAKSGRTRSKDVSNYHMKLTVTEGTRIL